MTDERMQSLSGCELAKKIHRIEPQLPVILVTGYRDADTLMRARDARVAEILDKPLNTQARRRLVAPVGSFQLKY